jgi:hypothetical protein
MSDPTSIPSLNFVIEALPAAEGMLVAANQPELAVFATALMVTLELVQSELATRGFDLAGTLKAADAAAYAALAAKFGKP